MFSHIHVYCVFYVIFSFVIGYDFEAFVEEIEEPTRLTIEDKKKSSVKQHDILPGFKAATNSDYQLER